MICTECKDVIPFYEEDHNPFDENDANITAILGSVDCFERYLQRQSQNSYLN